MKRFVIFVVTFFLVISGLVSCGNIADDKIKFSVLQGPSALAFCGMINEEFSSECPVEMKVEPSPDIVLPYLIKGELDGTILPSDKAISILEKNPDLFEIVAVCGKGNLSFVTNDSSVSSLSDIDFSKNEVYLPKGSTIPETIFSFICMESAMLSSDLKVHDNLSNPVYNYQLFPPEMIQALAAGKIKYAVLPEPFTTLAKQKLGDKIYIPFDIQKGYTHFSKRENYPFTVVVFRKNFIKHHNKQFENFMNTWQKSFDWVIANPHEAGINAEKMQIGIPASLCEAAIPVSALCAEREFDLAITE